jgi:hypothetical protein
MRHFFTNHWPAFLLILISLLLCILNYTPGTFLSGWDTVHPEFNFYLNFQRIFFGVFRTEQGLGAVAAHSHMVELPRMILLLIVSPLLPISFLRYFYIFLMLIIGPLGVYYLFRCLISQLTKHNSQISILSAFLAGLWYLLNLGTMQVFIVPFEMFATQYGFLPWLFFLSIQFLQEEKKRQRRKLLLFFGIISFFASPMAYAATLWYVFFSFFALFFLILCIHPLRRQFLLSRRIFVILLVMIAMNTYWLLPNLYFLKTQSATIQEANINKLFSEQAFLYNKEFGTLTDILLLKSFFFDWSIFNGRGFEGLVKQWTKHLQNPFIPLIGFSMSLIAISGIIFSIWKKTFFRWSLLGTLFVLFIFLFNDNPPTHFLFNKIQASLPLFKEALRFPHNKVYGIYMLVFAIYFGYGNYFLLSQLNRLRIRVATTTYTVIILVLLIIFMEPAFRSQLISPYMRITLPQDYFNLFSWMNKQPDTAKVALLPVHSFWGWEYHSGTDRSSPGFQGAGFLWFGMKQPLLHRDFDRWSPYNEQAYKELSYAVYSNNSSLLARVAQKYAIKYFILDESIIAPSQDPKVLYLPQLKKMLTDNSYFEKQATFGSILSVYLVKNTHDKLVSLLINPPNVQPSVQTLYEDFAYTMFGDYITDKDKDRSYYYPFRTQIDNQSKLLPNIFSITQEGIKIKSHLQINSLPQSKLISFPNEETAIPVSITVQKKNNGTEISFYPQLPFPNVQVSPLPLKFTLPFFWEDSLTLSINRSNTFSLLGFDTQSPLVIGKAFLSTQKDNTVAVFHSDPQYQEVVNLSKQSFLVSPCESLDKRQLFGIKQQENSFTIFAKNTPVCFLLPLSQLFQNKNLLELHSLLITKIAYGESGGNDKTNVCVANTSNGSCINYLSRILLPDQTSMEHIFATEVSSKDILSLSLRISLDATQISTLTQAEFARITFSLTKPMFTMTISAEDIANSITPALQNAEAQKEIIIPYSGSEQLSRNIISFPRTSGICQENPLVATGIREIKIVEERETFIRYISKEGPQCDHFSYPNIAHNQSYLLIIKSRNLSGLPLTICVTNRTSKRCDVYAHTTKSHSFVKDVFLIPPTDSSNDGYDININNLGVKRTPAINDLQDIQIIPFPFRWMSSLQIKPPLPHFLQSPSSFPISYLTNNQHKIILTLPKNNIDAQKIILLNYSFNSGWKAYAMVQNKSQIISNIKTIVPFLLGEEIKDKVIVNNWANGWILPNEYKNSSLQPIVVIIFLPQYLFYLGFLISSVVLGILILSWYRTKLI